MRIPASAAITVRIISTRSTVKNPGETIPGAERRPKGPPTSSVKLLKSRSLRLGTTRRARFRWGGGCVSCMAPSLPGHLLAHQDIDVFPVPVEQLAVELRLPVHLRFTAGKKLFKLAKHGIHLLRGNYGNGQHQAGKAWNSGHDK